MKIYVLYSTNIDDDEWAITDVNYVGTDYETCKEISDKEDTLEIWEHGSMLKQINLKEKYEALERKLELEKELEKINRLLTRFDII